MLKLLLMNLITNRHLNITDSYKNLAAIILFHLVYFPLSIFLITNYSLLISIPSFIFISFIHQKFMGEYLHEGAHFHIQKNKFANELVSNFLVGIFLLLPVSSYRRVHFPHHKFTSYFHDDDPETANLKIYKKSEFWKNIIIDLSGYNGIKVLLAYTLKKNKTNQFNIDKIFLVYILIHFFVFVLLIIYNYYIFYLIYYLSAGTLYKLQGRFRVLCQHIFINKDGSKAQYKVSTSRTIAGGLIEKIFFTSDIVAYHDLHHKHPSNPYRKLKKMFEKSNPKEEINSYSKTRFKIIRKYYKSLAY